jgi:acyl transferase domain-containing protein
MFRMSKCTGQGMFKDAGFSAPFIPFPKKQPLIVRIFSTQTGDPAEMGAVANTFKHRRRNNGPLTVGGVKANIGHGEAAAGMAELLKCIMMFKKDIIPPQGGMPHALNPKFPPLADLNIQILSESQPFVRQAGKPRRILLNNFDAAGVSIIYL